MKRFAEAIIFAAQVREDSFDHVKANELEKSDSIIKKFENCYDKTLFQAADEAAEKVGFDQTGTQPIYLLLRYAWNDINDWALSIKKEKNTRSEVRY